MTREQNDSRLLPLTVIEAAAGGDVEAINAVQNRGYNVYCQGRR